MHLGKQLTRIVHLRFLSDGTVSVRHGAATPFDYFVADMPSSNAFNARGELAG